MIRHGDVEGRALHVLRALRAADGPVVLGAAIGRADDEGFAEGINMVCGRVTNAAVAEAMHMTCQPLKKGAA